MKRRRNSAEHKIQAEAVKCLRRDFGVFLFSIPNGGSRHAVEAMNLRAEGLLPGVPDVFIPGLRLFLEFKAPKGRVSEDQEDVAAILICLGYEVEFPRTVEDAIAAVLTRL